MKLEPYPGWQNEYLWELGRLVVLHRIAGGQAKEKIRALIAMEVPKTLEQWKAVSEWWSKTEGDMKQRGLWPQAIWDVDKASI